MSAPGSDIAIAEARLLIAACAYVDAVQRPEPLDRRIQQRDVLCAAVDAYRAAQRALPPLPADHPLVRQGMAVVRRLLGQQETTE